MGWTESAPGSFERPLGAVEHVIWLIGASGHARGFEEWMLNAAIHFEAPLYEVLHRFRDAWLALRFEHPNIAACVSSSGQMTYAVPKDPASRQSWLHDSFFVYETAKDVSHVLMAMPRPPGPCLHVVPSTNTLVLAVPHYLSDARGILRLLARHLELAEGALDVSVLPWGQEVSRLVPSSEELIPMFSHISESQRQWIDSQAAGFLKSNPLRNAELAGDEKAPPKNPSRIYVSLSEKDTAAMVRACKTRGISVNAAMHAAVATMNLDGVEKYPDEYKVPVRRDLRHKLPAPYSGEASSCGLMVTSTCITLPTRGDYQTLVHRFEDYHKREYTDHHLKLNEALFLAIKQIIQEAPPTTPPGLDLEYSGLGVVDAFFKSRKSTDLVIDRVEVGLNTYTSGVGVWSWTFHRKFNLCLCYNDAYRSRKAMERDLGRVFNILGRELDIGSLTSEILFS
ncbi:hypothetical protein MMC20_002321 [Loxospora ochrophaea]|nr:hypothetical protein [Loxospora ochrophaea]